MRQWKEPMEGRFKTDIRFSFSVVVPQEDVGRDYFEDRMVLLYYQDPDKIKTLHTLRTLPVKILVAREEVIQLGLLVQDASHLEGDMAEVGTYMGGTAKIICEANPNKTLYTFDTFTGLPELGVNDDANKYMEGRFKSSYDTVAEVLEGCNVKLVKGDFRDTCEDYRDKTFSFVHIDVDLYDTTKFCLEFFYPRMVEGGIIVSHDYQNNKGVNMAINEFFEGKETIISLLGSQGLVVRGKK